MDVREDMWLLYDNERRTYRKIQDFNNTHRFTKINTVNILVYGFYTFRRDRRGEGVENHIACGPSIIMEEFTERPKTNGDFKRGLLQLLLLQQAGISHDDVKRANMFMRGDDFIFIDFGISESKSGSANQTVEGQDIPQYKKVWRDTVDQPPSDEEVTKLVEEISDLLIRPDSFQKKRSLEAFLKSAV